MSPDAFARRGAGGEIVTLGGGTMGTTWSARIVSPRPAATLRDAIERTLEGVVAQMSHWEADSDLSRFNRAAPGVWQELPADFAIVLATGLDVARRSNGAFDPAAGALIDLWGFGATTRRTTAPDAAECAAAIGGWRTIEQDGARFRRTGDARLDLSGIAKGFAADSVRRTLRALGTHDYLIEVGGELLGAGIKPDGQPWWVDLETPPGARLAPLRVALHGLAVASSGDYRRFFEHDGRRYGHTIDPRTGASVDNGVVSASVLHPSCMLADAWATALTVLGPDEAMALAEREKLAARIITDREHLSPALVAMLD